MRTFAFGIEKRVYAVSNSEDFHAENVLKLWLVGDK